MTEDAEHSARDALTGAIINVHEARIQLETGSLARADEALAVSQRLMLRAGAKDIGQLPNGRAFEDNVLSDRYRLRERVEKKDEKIEELQERIEELESDDDEESEDEQRSFLVRLLYP